MAQYEHLPIFRTAFQLTVYLEEAVRKMARYHKYTIGTRMRDRCAKVLRLIIRANNVRIGLGPAGASARSKVLEELRLEIEALKTDIQIGKELKAFASFDAFRMTAGFRCRSRGRDLGGDRKDPGKGAGEKDFEVLSEGRP